MTSAEPICDGEDLAYLAVGSRGWQRPRYQRQETTLDRGQAAQSEDEDTSRGRQDLLHDFPQRVLEAAKACSFGHQRAGRNLRVPQASTFAKHVGRVFEEGQVRPGAFFGRQYAHLRRGPAQAASLNICLLLRPAALAAYLDKNSGDPGKSGGADSGSLQRVHDEPWDVEAIGHRACPLIEDAVRSRTDTRERIKSLGKVAAMTVDVIVGAGQQVLP